MKDQLNALRLEFKKFQSYPSTQAAALLQLMDLVEQLDARLQAVEDCTAVDRRTGEEE